MPGYIGKHGVVEFGNATKRTILRVTEWSLDATQTVIETTSVIDLWKYFEVDRRSWSGTMTVQLEPADNTKIGDPGQHLLDLSDYGNPAETEENTKIKCWFTLPASGNPLTFPQFYGEAVITQNTINVHRTEVTTASFAFRGQEALVYLTPAVTSPP